MKKFIKLWLPVLLWMLLIFYLSSIPDLHSGFDASLDTILRKFAHIGEYAVLTMLFIRIFKGHRVHMPFYHIIILSALLSLLYAASDEFHQVFTLGREGSIRDVSIDAIGIFLISLLYASKNKVAKTVATHPKHS